VTDSPFRSDAVRAITTNGGAKITIVNQLDTVFPSQFTNYKAF
jgi:hypothetical protein